MPFKLSMGASQETYLRDPSLIPSHGGRYKVITNSSVIDTVKQELAAAGLVVDRSLYSSNGNVSVGNHYISYGTDENIGMVFTWVNSYDKSTRFHCSIGLHFKDTDGIMITSDMAFFMRKHTGTADIEMLDAVKDQISRADDLYNELLRRKDDLQSCVVTTDEMGDIIGRCFINDHLKADQLTSTKHKFDKMKSTHITLWEAYLILAACIQHSHPKSYTRSHIGCFDTVYDKYLANRVLDLSPKEISEQVAMSVIPEFDHNQMSIFDVIEEEVNMTNDLLITGFDNVEQPGSDFDVDKEVVFDFEEDEVPFDTTPVPDAFYEDQEKVENTLPEQEEFFNFDVSDKDVLDLPEL